MMTPDLIHQKLGQLVRDGFCVIDDVLPEYFLVELQHTSNRMIDAVETPPPHWKFQGSDIHVPENDDPIMDRLLHWSKMRDTLQIMGLDDFSLPRQVQIISKPPGGEALYWHQDWTNWNDPISCAPWPQYLFLSYYLTDTTIVNGCLRVIPGTHRRRIDLHDRLTAAHGKGAYQIVDARTHPDMFCDHSDAVDVTVKAGSLVIAEGRVLHAARANHGNSRRTLLLSWSSRPATVPAYWEDDTPEAIRNRNPDAQYEATRIPGQYLEPARQQR